MERSENPADRRRDLRNAKRNTGLSGLGLACLLALGGCSGGGAELDDDTRKNGGGGQNGGEDLTPPVISQLTVSPGQTFAVVSWITDEPATSSVDYGTTATYEIGTQAGAGMGTQHQFRLDGLSPETTYHFRVTSTDAEGNAAQPDGQTFQTTKELDTTAPVISNIQVVTTHDTATITWKTNEPADSRVDFGLNTSYSGGSDKKVNFVSSHEIKLAGLTSETTYHYRITTADPSGNSAQSADKQFLTEKKSAPGSKTSISQFGITWTFDRAYPAGQYANGDWWVVGPVKVIKIDPPSRSGSRVKNGSMINPSPANGNSQGYDSQMKHNSYSASRNVALDVSSSKPLTVPQHSSLVSTSSVDAIQTPQLQACQILTVLPAPAEPGDFRPPYSGTNKTSPFNVRQLNYSVLKKLKPTSKTPSLSSVERFFERPWLDHIPGWNGTEHHPINNMPDYGRELSENMGVGALMLNLDFTNAQKSTLLTRFVQVGIDLQGVVDDGGHRNWMNNGGHASGRKWPILFAGIVLNDSKMRSIGSKDVWFGEDMQTWIVTQADVGRNLDPDPRAPKTLYTQSHVGKAEWGIRHATSPISDNANWGATYRTCCTANVWYGFLLAAMIMDARGLWNHEPLFLYQDRYLSESRRLKIPDWQISYDAWSLEMWDTYRKNY